MSKKFKDPFSDEECGDEPGHPFSPKIPPLPKVPQVMFPNQSNAAKPKSKKKKDKSKESSRYMEEEAPPRRRTAEKARAEPAPTKSRTPRMDFPDVHD